MKTITYSAATKKNLPGMATTSTDSYSQGIVPFDIHSKIFVSMFHGHFMNRETPGTFEDEVNTLFKCNNLPTTNLPKNPPSAKILAQFQNTEKAETYEEAVEEMEEEENKDEL